MMKEMQINWYAIPNPDGYSPRPEWERTAGIDARGDIWVPSSIGEIAGVTEKQIFLCLGWECEPAVFRENHLFVRSKWMRREYPRTSEVLDKIEEKINLWDAKSNALNSAARSMRVGCYEELEPETQTR